MEQGSSQKKGKRIQEGIETLVMLGTFFFSCSMGLEVMVMASILADSDPFSLNIPMELLIVSLVNLLLCVIFGIAFVTIYLREGRKKKAIDKEKISSFEIESVEWFNHLTQGITIDFRPPLRERLAHACLSWMKRFVRTLCKGRNNDNHPIED